MVNLIKKMFGGSKTSGLKIRTDSKIFDGEKMEIIDIIKDIIKPNLVEGQNFQRLLKHILDYIVQFSKDNYFMVVDDLNEKDNVHLRVSLTKKDVVIMNLYRFNENDYKIYFISHNGDVNEIKSLFFQILKREIFQFEIRNKNNL